MSHKRCLAISMDKVNEVIEFGLPGNSDYLDEDNRGNVRVMNTSDDATYVLLDNLGNEFEEDIIIVNENGVEKEMLMSKELHDYIVGSRMKDLADDEQMPQFLVRELDMSEVGDLVEVEQEVEQEVDYDYEHEPSYGHPRDNEREEEDLDMYPPSSPSLPPSPPRPSPPVVQPASKARNSTRQIALRSFVSQKNNEDDDGSVKDVKPSEKMLEEFKGPRRYMLFDDLVATIVDFDEDSTPLVEFSMISDIVDEKLPVECGICPDVMHKSKLSKHHKTHLVPGTNRYACIYCTETYRDCKYLAGHARRHMGIRPYVCELCTLYFSTKQDLRVHNQRRHLEKEHICEVCGKTFAQNTQLKRHREATHEKKRRFQCQYCQKAYYKNFSLQEHIRNVHMGKRRMLKCPFCGMQCRDAHKMARHRKEMHLSQGTYVCHLCQEEFTDISYFDAHKRSIQCRSNTRRFVKADGNREGSDSESISGRNIDGQDDEYDGMGPMQEEYDEDDGLLVEDNQPDEQGSSSNRQYLDGSDQQYVQLSDYDDQHLLVENAVDAEDGGEDLDELLNEDEYFNAVQQHHQQQALQQFHHSRGQDYNDGLIYEITLKTEDN
ncbi:zinc finger and SCAN domain-containing protein 21 [Drosophila sechellia]|nr:zinc finger and SCAN domain-containing protein 21 [Drosophila sechellia]